MPEIPLVLIHGYPFDHTMWFSTIAALGTKARVLAPDLPGFGRNPPHPDKSPSMKYYAEYLTKELAASGFKKAVVAGMSMGGYVALAFAEKFPNQLAGLGLISSQAEADAHEVKSARMETIRKVRASGVSVVTDAIMPKMFAENADAQLRKYPLDGAAKAGPDGLCWALEAMAKRPDRSDLVKALTCPVLMIHGAEDRIVPIAKARGLAEQCRNTIFQEIPRAGHATPLENPDAVANGLIRLMNVCRELEEKKSAAATS